MKLIGTMKLGPGLTPIMSYNGTVIAQVIRIISILRIVSFE